MKGLQGILIAVALGIVAAVCNWFYITGHAKDFVKVSFVVVKSGTQIDVGDRFKKSHFEKVDIPENNLGHLETVAVRWSDLDTVVGQTSPRSFSGSEILLRYDLKTPPQRDVSELLGENEVLRWVPVDQRSFTPDHVNPGNLVRFVVPMFTAAKGARGNARPNGSAAAPQSRCATRPGRNEPAARRHSNPPRPSEQRRGALEGAAVGAFSVAASSRSPAPRSG